MNADCFLDTNVLVYAITADPELADKRYRTSYWDDAILAVAARAGVSTVYSEDLNHGQDYGAVVVINPFATETDSMTDCIQE